MPISSNPVAYGGASGRNRVIAKASAGETTKPQNNVSPTKRAFRSPRAASGGSSRRPMSSSVLAMKTTRVTFKTTVRWSVTSGVRAAGLLRPINP